MPKPHPKHTREALIAAVRAAATALGADAETDDERETAPDGDSRLRGNDGSDGDSRLRGNDSENMGNDTEAAKRTKGGGKDTSSNTTTDPSPDGAAVPGAAPFRLSITEFCGHTGINPSRIYARFPDWPNLCEAAGVLPAGRPDVVPAARILADLHDAILAAGGIEPQKQMVKRVAWSNTSLVRRFGDWGRTLCALRDWVTENAPDFPYGLELDARIQAQKRRKAWSAPTPADDPIRPPWPQVGRRMDVGGSPEGGVSGEGDSRPRIKPGAGPAGNDIEGEEGAGEAATKPGGGQPAPTPSGPGARIAGGQPERRIGGGQPERRIGGGQPAAGACGPPLAFRAMVHAPVNELGVVLLFGMIAADIGYAVDSVAAAFPDCAAKRLIADGPRQADQRWQPVRVEFEYRSRNFAYHRHDADHCDVIICWQHDWPDCPIEVLALDRVVAGLMAG